MSKELTKTDRFFLAMGFKHFSCGEKAEGKKTAHKIEKIKENNVDAKEFFYAMGFKEPLLKIISNDVQAKEEKKVKEQNEVDAETFFQIMGFKKPFIKVMPSGEAKREGEMAHPNIIDRKKEQNQSLFAKIFSKRER